VPFNANENQYHYNMATRTLDEGPWLLLLRPGDGTTHSNVIVVK
jgi:hypothetical protein